MQTYVYTVPTKRTHVHIVPTKWTYISSYCLNMSLCNNHENNETNISFYSILLDACAKGTCSNLNTAREKKYFAQKVNEDIYFTKCFPDSKRTRKPVFSQRLQYEINGTSISARSANSQTHIFCISFVFCLSA